MVSGQELRRTVTVLVVTHHCKIIVKATRQRQLSVNCCLTIVSAS